MQEKEFSSFFLRLEDKIDKLTNEVTEYKTTSASQIASLTERIAQSDEKLKQLFIFHNENILRHNDVLSQLKDSRHEVGNLKNREEYHNSSLEKVERDLNSAMKKMSQSISDLGDKIDKNDKKDEAIRNQGLGRKSVLAFIITVSVVLGGLATAGTFLLMWR